MTHFVEQFENIAKQNTGKTVSEIFDIIPRMSINQARYASIAINRELCKNGSLHYLVDNGHVIPDVNKRGRRSNWEVELDQRSTNPPSSNSGESTMSIHMRHLVSPSEREYLLDRVETAPLHDFIKYKTRSLVDHLDDCSASASWKMKAYNLIQDLLTEIVNLSHTMSASNKQKEADTRHTEIMSRALEEMTGMVKILQLTYHPDKKSSG